MLVTFSDVLFTCKSERILCSVGNMVPLGDKQ